VIVLDTSALVAWLLGHDGADMVAQRMSAADSLHAPALIDLEVAQVFRRYARKGELDDARAAQALVALAELDMTRHSHELLLPLVWRLRENCTAYDAAFAALAAALAAPLVTLDAKTARAPWPLSALPIEVEVIPA